MTTIATAGLSALAGALALGLGATPASALYLNIDNISVSVGAGTSPGTFNNTFDDGQTIDKVINAPTAASQETHTQTTHIWYTPTNPGGGLELIFDFGVSYDISMLHFWNYTSENYDVDQIAFTFFDAADQVVGTETVGPATGTEGGAGIQAQDIALTAPLNVRSVAAFLTGSNGQVDFQNLGFTAEPSASAVPLPATLPLAAGGLAALAWIARRRR